MGFDIACDFGERACLIEVLVRGETMHANAGLAFLRKHISGDIGCRLQIGWVPERTKFTDCPKADKEVRILKKLLALLLIVGICAIGTAVLAATDDDVVTVTVDYVDLLTVPGTAALTLTTSTAGATAYDQATLNQTGASSLKYSHNSTSGKKITATAVANGGNPVNNITLKTAIADGEASTAVVSAGTDQTGVLLWDNIVAGGYTKDLNWTADATLAVTKAGANIDLDYIWTVTFTSADH